MNVFSVLLCIHPGSKFMKEGNTREGRENGKKKRKENWVTWSHVLEPDDSNSLDLWRSLDRFCVSQGIFEGFSTVDRQHPACNLERAGSATQGKVKLREMRDTLTAVRGQDFLAGPVVILLLLPAFSLKILLWLLVQHIILAFSCLCWYFLGIIFVVSFYI